MLALNLLKKEYELSKLQQKIGKEVRIGLRWGGGRNMKFPKNLKHFLPKWICWSRLCNIEISQIQTVKVKSTCSLSYKYTIEWMGLIYVRKIFLTSGGGETADESS